MEDGDEGPSRRGRNGSNIVSQQGWWRFLFQVRPHTNCILLYTGRLLHEVLVDAFAEITESRLEYYRHHQQQLRITQYSGLMDALGQHDSVGNNIGQNVVLPRTMTGSPRYMRHANLDAMAITRKFGPPDFFITFTCNPTWQEITLALQPGELPADRPDIVNRVFNIKLNQLLYELKANHILGEVAAWCYTIEFQKRGLPHAHILVILAPAGQIHTAEQIDAAVCAELPDPARQPFLYAVVVKNMLHGPCGAANPNAGCMRKKNGVLRCRFSYPKPYQDETVMGENQKTVYRRRPGRTFRKSPTGYVYSNRDVAPYNPFLSIRYNAHINVESCVGYKSLKYVFKYVYKGPDMASIDVGGNQPRIDETRLFVDARYVAAHEAHWRMNEFSTSARYPAVVQLPIHLENEQTVVVDPDAVLDEEMLQRESIRCTMLTEFFAVNQNSPGGPTPYLYQDFPHHFTWNISTRKWSPRQRGGTIGRVVWIPINRGDTYFLRLLLVNVPGFTSFLDARTVDGLECPTYRAACLARGLLQDDGECVHALEEAAGFQLGDQLRHLFITILTMLNPADPLALWNQFRERLADDCAHRLETVFNVAAPTQAQAEDLCLCYLRDGVLRLNASWKDTTLPDPSVDYTAINAPARNRLLQEQRSFNTEQLHAFVTANEGLLNDAQHRAYSTLYVAFDSQRGGLFFVDGPGGTGKTFLQNLVLAKQRAQGRIALAVASSGIAATLLDGGTTAHSRFKIPLEVDEDSRCSIPAQSHLATVLRETSLIFWDEVVMCHRHAIEAVSRSLQDLRPADDPRREQPFGGIVVCFCGDFRQTLPIVPRGSRPQIVRASLRESHLWRLTSTLRLTENMRLSRGDLSPEERERRKAFALRLLEVEERTGQDGTVLWGTQDMSVNNTMEGLLERVFPRLGQRAPEEEVLKTTAILAARNDRVAEVNRLALDTMRGELYTRLSADACKDADGANSHHPIELLHAIEGPGLPPHELRLKKDCVVILLRNLDPSRCLCNGTRLRVVDVGRLVLRCRILGTRADGQIVQLPRIPCESNQKTDCIEFIRMQFPIKLAFAMTINKAQGQSLSQVGLLLDPEVFSHGQLYVALSRVTTPDGICMVTPDTAAGRCGRVKNVVYPEVLDLPRE